ncbi:MAG: preprotein translocase subunit SecE [Patescibacteria group bacterium]|nr:preprotein translocase subunit SecE [Patescibacteria group bacterium]MDE2144985.1 preprotein translocase subunit SecE [Patescibacteria group bacterium]
MLTNLRNYLIEAREEFGRVKWLSRAETTRLVTVVIIITAVVAAYLGILDNVFVAIIKKFVLKQ